MLTPVQLTEKKGHQAAQECNENIHIKHDC